VRNRNTNHDPPLSMALLGKVALLLYTRSPIYAFTRTNDFARLFSGSALRRSDWRIDILNYFLIFNFFSDIFCHAIDTFFISFVCEMQVAKTHENHSIKCIEKKIITVSKSKLQNIQIPLQGKKRAECLVHSRTSQHSRKVKKRNKTKYIKK
jgi:hypothetical protein